MVYSLNAQRFTAEKGCAMKVVTIDREFGAGGHTVGREVAKRLGIEFYDRDIIALAAKTGGIDPSNIEAEEEVISRTDAFIHAINPTGYDAKDTIFRHESQAIVQFANMGPCVILGRCANAILDDAGIEHVSVFLHADTEHRMASVGKILGISDPAAIKKAMRKRDVARHAYYEAFTGKQWGAIREYTLSLDTGVLGFQKCAEIVCSVAGE